MEESNIKEYEALKQELSLVSEKAPFGAHVKVASKVGISIVYCQKIRIYEGAKTPTEDNIKLVKNMIKEYRRLINKEIEKLQV